MMQALAKQILLRGMKAWTHGQLRVVLPSGHECVYGVADGRPPADLQILDDRAFARVLLGGNVGVGESYMAGEWTSDDLPRLVTAFLENGKEVQLDGAVSWLGRGVRLASHWLQANTRRGSEKNIHAHYDLGNDLYRTFLDDTMAYSCAVFDRDGLTLEDAQRRKFAEICNWLHLDASDHLLEIGSGWGGFAIEAARRTGCRITTVTISRQQYELAKQRVAEAGLEGQIDLRYCDYRDLAGQFDKIVSIEMFEAVGRAFWKTYFQQCERLLKPGGKMFLQTIALPDCDTDDPTRGATWLHKYIFPGSTLPTLPEIVRTTSQSTDLRVQRVRDIGLHYVPTLAQWRQRFWNAADQVRAQGFSESFVRMWDYYLALCEGMFATRVSLNYQLVLAR